MFLTITHLLLTPFYNNVVNVVLVGGVAASVASFLPGVLLLSPSIMVYAAGALTIANAPYAAFKEVRITKLPSLRLLNNKLAEEATRLEKEVDALSEEIDAIAPEAERAGAVEEELREIADRQQFNVDRLIDLVNENEEVLNQMRDNLRQKIVQDIVRIVIKSDANNDQTFCKVESKMLALKIRLQLQEYGVEFDEMKFYKVLNVDPSLPRVLKIVQKLIPKFGEDDESESDEDDINEDFEDDMYDMFRLASEKSLRMTGSIHDEPENRRASSALMKSSSWRSATGDAGDSTSSDTLGARQCTLALMQVPSTRRERRKSKGRRGSLVP